MYKLARRAHGAYGAHGASDTTEGVLMMSKEQLMMKLLTAQPDMLARVEAILENRQTETTPADRRLLTMTAAAQELGCARMTVFRMARDGRLPVVETRAGRYRVPSSALTALLQDGKFCTSKRVVGHA